MKSPELPSTSALSAEDSPQLPSALANGDGPDPSIAFDHNLFRQVIDAAPDAMIVVNAEGQMIIVNTQVDNLFGYARGELLGAPVEVLIPSRVRTQHERYRADYSRAPRARYMGANLVLDGQRKDGTSFPAEVSLSPLVTRTGTLICAAIRDVSERKRAERLTHTLNVRLLSAVDSIQGMFALFDAEDQLVLCNSACRELLIRGMDGPVTGSRYARLLDAMIDAGLFDLGSESQAAFRERLLAYHGAPKGSLTVTTTEGQTLRLTSQRTPEGGVVSTIWDITPDVVRERELQVARQQADAANTAKSEFLASMSHELRTPLNAILGFTQLLQRDKRAPLAEHQQTRLAQVAKAGSHLLHLIDEVLDLSRIEAGGITISPEPVDLKEVLQEVRTTLEPMAARRKIRLEINPVPIDHQTVTADRTRLIQALINFGSNAIKYGKPSGYARFEVSGETPAFTRIQVHDDGNGIALDKQHTIFQPFQRAGQETGSIEGTGIGLTITKRLAELMGGQVGFVSGPGEGATFWIELPTRLIRAALSLPPQIPRGWASLGRDISHPYTIVYVEDNPSNIDLMRDLMGELDNVELLVAPTAEVGIELVRGRRPDAVIMDINLPGMNGYEATRQLQQWPETRSIPVIALSAAAMNPDKKRAELAGFYRYLTKPVQVDELLSTLQELLTPRGGPSEAP